MNTKRFLRWILWIIILMALAVVPIGTANAQDTDGEETQTQLGQVIEDTANPVPVSPSGTITDKTPTYKWTKLIGATQYQVQVYKGTLKVLDKLYTGSACTTIYCTATPTTVLVPASYKWRVRAYLNGAWKTYSAFKYFAVIKTVPTLISPSGTIYSTKPTYKWTRIIGASKYQIQVYRGTTKVLDKTLSSAYCSTSYCTATPTTILAYASHKWHVRAYISGAWYYYSSYRTFTVKAGFDSQFTTNASGWTPVYGSWGIVSPGYYHSHGLTSLINAGKTHFGDDYHPPSYSSAHSGVYSKFIYQARMKRTGTTAGLGQYIIFHGTPTIGTADKLWSNGYFFFYVNQGAFALLEDTNGHVTNMKQELSSYINKTGWNTLKVVADGSTGKIQLYINNHLVWSVTNTAHTSGHVGIGFQNPSTSEYLDVDWANLTVP